MVWQLSKSDFGNINAKLLSTAAKGDFRWVTVYILLYPLNDYYFPLSLSLSLSLPPRV